MQSVIKNVILFSSLFFLSIKLIAQENDQYLIFQFKEYSNQKVHAPKSYYWLIRTDTFLRNDMTFSHLFIDNIYKNNILDCIKGSPFDPFIVDGQSEFEIDRFQREQNLKFKKLFQRKRKKIDGFEDTNRFIKIYYTAIKGDFCETNFHEIGTQRTGYNGKVSIPIKNFSFSRKIVKDIHVKVKYQDFSKFKFDVIY